MQTSAALFAHAPHQTHLSKARRWGAVWLMFLAAVINFIDRGSLSVGLPLI